MSFPFTPRDINAELYLGGDWVNVSTDVFQRDPISIRRGRANESARVQPSRCTLTLDNQSGNYTTRNPLGDYYATLGRNTPLRVAVNLTSDTFARTVSGGWGSDDTGLAWDTPHGSGGTVQASDFAVAAEVGTQSVPVVSGHRSSWATSILQRDVEIAATVSLAISNVTGGDLEPCNLLLRGTSASSYYMCRVVITAAEAVTVSFHHFTAGELVTPVTVSGLTFGAGVSLRVRAQAEGQTLRAKVWNPAGAEPYDWQVSVDDDTITGPGWVGIRSGVAAANSNTLPVLFSYDDIEVKSPRFAGEVSSWPAKRDVSGVDRYVPIEASGIMRRLDQGDVLRSALRRGILSVSPLAYWPCEDSDGSTVIASGLPSGAPMASIPNLPSFAANDDFACSDRLPTMGSNLWFAPIPGYSTSSGQLQTRFLLSVPAAGTTNGETIVRLLTSGGTTGFWDIYYGTGGTLNLTIYDPAGASLHSTGYVAYELNGRPCRVSLSLTQDGADIDWNLSTIGIDGVAGELTGTLAGRAFNQGTSLFFAVGAALSTVTIGHITVENAASSIFDLSDQLTAYVGETAAARLSRLCSENGIPFSLVGDPAFSIAMGTQRVATLMSLLRECETADMGTLYESRGTTGLAYRTRESLYNTTAVASLDFANNELAPPFEPVDDDQLISNDVTAKRADGGEFRFELTTGRMSTLDPSDGGAGRYDQDYTTNVETDSQLPDVAAWLVHMGTVDEARYPTVNLDLANARVAADATLAASLLDLDVDNRLLIINAANANIYDDISQVVRGYTETLLPFDHRLAVNCTPESPYQVVELDDPAELGRLDSSSSVLDRAITDSQTAIYVRSTAETWTTASGDLPIPIVIGGEEMSVTAVGSATPTLVATGTADHQNNASCTPGFPTGHAAEDLLVILAAIRNSGTGVPVAPSASWSTLFTYGNMAAFAKVDNGSEPAAVVTFTGGAANATCSAQMAAFRHASTTLTNSGTGSLNGSAANISIPSYDPPGRGTSLILQFGWKQDDWTSVAALTGSTEIGDTSSTSGDDQGIVWDFRVDTGEGISIQPTSFVVTGGANAISRSLTLSVWAVQQLTVTRAVNGVTKAHSAGDEVRLARPSLVAL